MLDPPPKWFPPVASLILPGTGQIVRGVDRGVLYLGIEAFLLTRFVSAISAGRRERDRYRDLAFLVARRRFDPTVRDTAFQYFEQMERFVESGPYDIDPGPALVPPGDAATFNGQIWELARETFFADPNDPPPPGSAAYERALDFYRRRAVGPAFLWTWQGAELELDNFRQAIRDSDDAFRRSSRELGLILANHLLSAIDALVMERLASRAPNLRLASSVISGTAGQPNPTVYWTIAWEF